MLQVKACTPGIEKQPARHSMLHPNKQNQESPLPWMKLRARRVHNNLTTLPHLFLLPLLQLSDDDLTSLISRQVSKVSVGLDSSHWHWMKAGPLVHSEVLIELRCPPGEEPSSTIQAANARVVRLMVFQQSHDHLCTWSLLRCLSHVKDLGRRRRRSFHGITE